MNILQVPNEYHKKKKSNLKKKKSMKIYQVLCVWNYNMWLQVTTMHS
jgi:hypothetical protein